MGALDVMLCRYREQLFFRAASPGYPNGAHHSRALGRFLRLTRLSGFGDRRWDSSIDENYLRGLGDSRERASASYLLNDVLSKQEPIAVRASIVVFMSYKTLNHLSLFTQPQCRAAAICVSMAAC
jgi:hypothetical protein